MSREKEGEFSDEERREAALTIQRDLHEAGLEDGITVEEILGDDSLQEQVVEAIRLRRAISAARAEAEERRRTRQKS